MRRAAERLEAWWRDSHGLDGGVLRASAFMPHVTTALAHSVRLRRGLLVAQAPPRGLNVEMARTNTLRCVCLLDVLKVVCRVEKGPLRLVEDNYWAVEADQQILRGPIMPAHFHSFYDGTDGSSYLIKPLSAANAIPRAEVSPGSRHGWVRQDWWDV